MSSKLPFADLLLKRLCGQCKMKEILNEQLKGKIPREKLLGRVKPTIALIGKRQQTMLSRTGYQFRKIILSLPLTLIYVVLNNRYDYYYYS